MNILTNTRTHAHTRTRARAHTHTQEFLGKLSELPDKLGDMSTMPHFLGGQVSDAVAYETNDGDVTRQPWNSPEINAAIDQLGEQRAWDAVQSRGPQIQQFPPEQRGKVWLQWASETA